MLWTGHPFDVEYSSIPLGHSDLCFYHNIYFTNDLQLRKETFHCVAVFVSLFTKCGLEAGDLLGTALAGQVLLFVYRRLVKSLICFNE